MEWVSVGVFRTVLACSVAKTPLDHAVLEGVEGDDGQSSAGCKQFERCIEGTLELAEFIIDGHADGLEGARCGVCSTPPVARGFSHTVGECEGAGPRATLKDGPGAASGPRLFAAASQEADQFRFGDLVQEFCRALAAVWVHPHVDGTGGSEAEAAPWLVELWRADSKVQQDTVEGPQSAGELTHLGEGASERSESVSEMTEAITCRPEGKRVAIDPSNLSVWSAALQEGVAVSATTQGAVQIAATWRRLEGLYGRVEQY